MKNVPSPNFDSREGHAVDMLVLHYTGMKTPQEALARLKDPESKVSAHYMIDEDGLVIKLVDEEQRAWHAGVSSWRGHTNINQRSVGIELVNPGHEFGYRPFPILQMESVALLANVIAARHGIPKRNIVAHSDVAPSRKEDPGELFNWKYMAEQGVGLWPKVDARVAHEKQLADYGYDISDMEKAITAFQRHFRPNSLTGQWDSECSGLLAGLRALL